MAGPLALWRNGLGMIRKAGIWAHSSNTSVSLNHSGSAVSTGQRNGLSEESLFFHKKISEERVPLPLTSHFLGVSVQSPHELQVTLSCHPMRSTSQLWQNTESFSTQTRNRRDVTFLTSVYLVQTSTLEKKELKIGLEKYSTVGRHLSCMQQTWV